MITIIAAIDDKTMLAMIHIQYLPYIVSHFLGEIKG